MSDQHWRKRYTYLRFACGKCSKPMEKKPKSGVCQACRKKPRGNCSVCSVELGKGNTSGMCRTHTINAIAAELRKTPEHQAMMKRIGHQNVKAMHTPEVLARSIPKRREGAKRRSERIMAWCPQEYRSEYVRLRQNGQNNAAIAKSLILNRIKADRMAHAIRWRLDDAVHYLRRFTHVTPKEGGFQYGTAFLTREELINRAVFKGWHP